MYSYKRKYERFILSILADMILSTVKSKICKAGWRHREKMEAVTDFLFLGSKITVDSDYSHEIKRLLLLGRKTMTNLESILKSRDITLPTKVCIVKALVFPVDIYGFESWSMKKAEH